MGGFGFPITTAMLPSDATLCFKLSSFFLRPSFIRLRCLLLICRNNRLASSHISFIFKEKRLLLQIRFTHVLGHFKSFNQIAIYVKWIGLDWTFIIWRPPRWTTLRRVWLGKQIRLTFFYQSFIFMSLFFYVTQ